LDSIREKQRCESQYLLTTSAQTQFAVSCDALQGHKGLHGVTLKTHLYEAVLANEENAMNMGSSGYSWRVTWSSSEAVDSVLDEKSGLA
jgi:elongation factor P hydroxylase